MLQRRLALTLIGWFIPIIAFAYSTDESVLAAYTLVVSTDESPSGLLTRAVLPVGIGCPQLKVGQGVENRRITMMQRSNPANTFSAFSNLTVCEAPMPRGVRTARVGDLSVPARIPSIIQRIGVLGDTGCRMKKTLDQACDSPSGWPLGQVASSLTEKKPEVVFFMGDFFYREFICDPAQTLTCGTSPAPLDINFDHNSVSSPFPKYVFSDSDYGWIADVFIPMKTLLSAAPLVVVRGNHESCQRGGNGYFKFFDPHQGNQHLCAPVPKTDASGSQVVRDGHPQWKTPDPLLTDAWSTSLRVGPARYLRVSVVDSAYGYDHEVDSAIYPALRAQYQRASDLASAQVRVRGRVPENWLLVHQPLFGLDCAPETISIAGQSLFGDQCKWVSETQTAAAYGLLANYHLVLSSHIHLAQAVQIPGQPGQLVVGNGGTMLQEVGVPYPTALPYGPLQYPNGQPVAGLPAGVTPYPMATSIWTERRFGFAIATPKRVRGEWNWTHYAPDGSEFANCDQKGTQLQCQSQ